MSERAMLSEAGAVGVGHRHAYWGATWRDAAEAAEREVKRVLAETEPKGGAVARVRLSSAASCRHLGHETSMMALAEALAEFVAREV